jgi:hypothetical protein
MELFAMFFAIPAGQVLGQIYAYLVASVVPRFDWLTRIFIFGSCLVLLGLLVEIALLSTVGAVPSRELLGNLMVALHCSSFMLGAPAIANVIAIPKRMRTKEFRILAGVAFGLISVGVILMQYYVFEEWYGVDGSGGPFSAVIECDFSMV